MIKEAPLPEKILDKIGSLAGIVRKNEAVIAFYMYGSAVNENLKPLSDLDFAILLKEGFNKWEVFNKELELRNTISDYLRTEEYDLSALNNIPPRFAFHVIKNGKLFFCKDDRLLARFIEKVVKIHLDFSFYRNEFNRIFYQKAEEIYG